MRDLELRTELAELRGKVELAEAERDAFRDSALALQHELECYIDNCGDEAAAREDIEGLVFLAAGLNEALDNDEHLGPNAARWATDMRGRDCEHGHLARSCEMYSCEMCALIAERDQLRAENARLLKVAEAAEALDAGLEGIEERQGDDEVMWVVGAGTVVPLHAALADWKAGA